MTQAQRNEEKYPATAGAFLTYHEERERTEKWLRVKARDIRIYAPEELSLLRTLEKDSAAEITNTDWLTVKCEENYYPLRECALSSILERAKIHGSALKRMSLPNLANVLNSCFKVANGQALVYLSNGAVSAIHGGDPSDYSILPISRLFTVLTKELSYRFPGYKYIAGYSDPGMSAALFQLPDNGILNSYAKELTDIGKKYYTLIPQIRFVTSNIGTSSAAVYTYITTETGKRVKLGTAISVAHKNGAGLLDFQSVLRQIYPKFVDTTKRLSELLHIRIEYPVSAMREVMTSIGIPKKYAAAALDMYKTQYGINAANAHDIYWSISEVLFLAENDNLSPAKLTALEDRVTKALHIRWQDYDMPEETDTQAEAAA